MTFYRYQLDEYENNSSLSGLNTGTPELDAEKVPKNRYIQRKGDQCKGDFHKLDQIGLSEIDSDDFQTV